MKTLYVMLPLMLCVTARAVADLYVVPDDGNKTPTSTALPVVNDRNCKVENIKKIEDKAAREAFAGLCLRRGEFVKSKPIAW
ncbi:entry exclusion lipoprotein TrbK [Methylomonas sp. LWB]|uniref:entry exclusion lipoprotein TrbK n=1 Tax=Methylomonas sp. LWB TaxID=1905845 RepID=UPI0020C8A43C|nr:entry exclusion lipoprotein TrbK [Methylomonas sp. LWB]